MQRMYLTKMGTKIVERPQHTYLRVAIALWGSDIGRVKETYDALSKRKFTHASPTLFNAGFKNSNLASCFLVHCDDSLSDIFKCLGDVAQLSKYGGGIGLHMSDIRGRGSTIRGTNGESDGIVPMLKVFDTTSAYANQGGRRKGSFAIYLEPHHPDIMDFLLLRRNQGEESLRARNLFYAVWLNDLFMKRVEADASWSLLDPHECPGLTDAFGKEYEDLYTRYESEGKVKKVVKARDVWNAMITTQIETGMPYVLNKDSVNAKNMQSNAGSIKGSNLCAEIVEYTSKEETAVCVIGSIVLKNYVKNGAFDFEDLRKHVKILTKNLDRSIDAMTYSIPETRTSNMRRRPVGVGVQGLQDVFFKLQMPFDSDAARVLNREIFEHIYFAAVEASCELADEHGPHPTFEDSPASRGVMQYHLWGVTPGSALDWSGLEERIKKGVRNSLTTAMMPTASTAQICGSVEAMEPITSNIYSRRTLAGEFPVVNSYLVRELIERGTWTETMKNQIIANGGSIQRVIGIHPDIKAVYKTAWELSMKSVIDMAADRGAFVDQTQSMNLFLATPTMKSVSSMLFYAWKNGLKTLLYYLRTKPSANAIKVTVDECIACSA
jgi:ribonucleoside-diphosphate reductase alpha subunit